MTGLSPTKPSRDAMHKPWSAKAVYEGLKPIICGTITMPVDAMQHEIEDAMRKKMSEHLPEGFQILELMCGAVFFVGDDKDL